MFHVTLLVLAVGCAIAAPSLKGRIVGGIETTIQAHPHQVSIQTKKGQHLCGGTLISECVVLTAAHCIDLVASDLQVRLGSTDHSRGGILTDIENAHVHEDYNPFTNDNDIALITLSKKCNETSKIRSLPLASTSPKTGTRAVVSGWGLQSEDGKEFPVILREVSVRIIGRKQCSSDRYKYGGEITKKMICAYANDKDSCEGDSGGPLVADGKLVGIVSFGNGCAKKRYPGVYTNVAALKKWIAINSGLKSKTKFKKY